MRADEGPLLVPSPVLGENRLPTPVTRRAALEVHLAEVEQGDISRIAEFVEQYVSLPLGIVGAAVIAERLNLTEVTTVCRKNFSIVRPRHISAFGLPSRAL